MLCLNDEKKRRREEKPTTTKKNNTTRRKNIIHHHLLLINTELYFRRGRTDIKIFYNFKSSETKTTEYHLNMTLSLARNF